MVGHVLTILFTVYNSLTMIGWPVVGNVSQNLYIAKAEVEVGQCGLEILIVSLFMVESRPKLFYFVAV